AGPLDEGRAPPLDDVEDVELLRGIDHARAVVAAVGVLGLTHVHRQGEEADRQDDEDERRERARPDEAPATPQTRLGGGLHGVALLSRPISRVTTKRSLARRRARSTAKTQTTEV